MKFKEAIELFVSRVEGAKKHAYTDPGFARLIIGNSIKTLVDRISGTPVSSMVLGVHLSSTPLMAFE